MSVNIVDKSTGNLTKIAGNPIEQASGISYDHTSSGMQANNVQAAVDELKSGLTNVNVALSVPENSGKNVLPLSIDRLKKSNTTGTWSGNVYTVGYNTYTVSVDNNGIVTSIEGTSTNIDSSPIRLDFNLKAGSYILSSGFEELFGVNDTFLQKDGVTIARGNAVSPGQNFTLSEDSELTLFFRVTNITKTCYPMIRPAAITDSTFTPYIPSVESRIEDVESGLDTVKSGLINYRTQNDLNLEVPDRKNVLPLTLSGIKAANFREEWVGNVCTIKGVTYTIQTDSNEIVTEITSNGTATGGNADLYLYSGMDSFLSKCEGMVLNGSTGGSASTYGIGGYSKGIIATTGDVTITSDLASAPALYIRVNTGITVDTTFKPMIRPATITDPTFAPYIPSVESRIEAVESGLNNVSRNNFGSGVDVTSYDTEANKYTFPDDGYLVGFIGSDEIKVKIQGATTSTPIEALLNTGVAVSVKKGMRFYVMSNTAGKLVAYVPFAI